MKPDLNKATEDPIGTIRKKIRNHCLDTEFEEIVDKRNYCRGRPEFRTEILSYKKESQGKLVVLYFNRILIRLKICSNKI